MLKTDKSKPLCVISNKKRLMHSSQYGKDTAEIEFSQATKRRQILHFLHLIMGKINLLERERGREKESTVVSKVISFHITSLKKSSA